MADIDDRWYRTDKATGERAPTARHGTNKRWDVRWRDDEGRQRHKAFERKKGPGGAESFLAQVTTDLERGTYIDPKARRTKFREYDEEWRLAQVHRPATSAKLETHLRRHIYPSFGHRALGSIRTTEVQAWVRSLELVLAPSTIRIVYFYLATILRAAVLDKKLPETPCIKIKLPEEEPEKVEPRATEEIEALIDAMPERYRALVILGAGSGLRQGECFGLEVSQIDFLRRELEVSQQLILVSGKPQIGPPKTKASYRTVPLPQVVINALAAHLAAFPPVEVELLDTTIKPVPKRRMVRLVFTSPAGLPLLRKRFSEVWRPAARTAGLPDATTFHDLRHYYASLLIRRNLSVKTVQARLGHKSAMETLDTYAHLWPDSEDQTREAIDAALRRPTSEVTALDDAANECAPDVRQAPSPAPLRSVCAGQSHNAGGVGL
jgi:integrase